MIKRSTEIVEIVGWISAAHPPESLSRHKDELLVEYAIYQMNNQLFVQKYPLYLPDREELRRELELTLREARR